VRWRSLQSLVPGQVEHSAGILDVFVKFGQDLSRAFAVLETSLTDRPISTSQRPERPRPHHLGITNAARTGGGITASLPLTAFQMISLNSRSSLRSSISRWSF